MTPAAVWICATCGVEHVDDASVCPICADERQWLPAAGQRWTTLAQLEADGHRTRLRESEPGLWQLTVEPTVGIGQTAFLVTGDAGSVLWDPPGFVDDAAVERIRSHGKVLGITASHPHMFGAQLEWSRRLDDAHRRARRGSALGRPLHRLGARRLRRPHLIERGRVSTRAPITTRIAARQGTDDRDRPHPAAGDSIGPPAPEPRAVRARLDQAP